MKPSGVVAEILRLAQRQAVPIREVPRRELDSRSRTRNPQGVIAFAAGFSYAELKDVLTRVHLPGDRALFVAVDGINDPQNLGALARSAEAAGVHALIVPRRRAAPVTDVAERASAGALEHLPVAQVPNLSRALEELKENGVWVVALDADAPKTIYELEVAVEPLCLVVGSEGTGVSHLVRERADDLVRIPMQGSVASLNASAAGAVALFEIRRRRAVTEP